MKHYYTQSDPVWGLLHGLMDGRTPFDGWADRASAQRWPKVRAWSSDESLCVEAELPGVESSDVSVEVDGDVLVIAGERKSGEASEAKALLDERFTGKFERRLQLPFRVAASDVKARYENGLLRVTVPKAAEEQRRKIQVEAA